MSASIVPASPNVFRQILRPWYLTLMTIGYALLLILVQTRRRLSEEIILVWLILLTLYLLYALNRAGGRLTRGASIGLPLALLTTYLTLGMPLALLLLLVGAILTGLLQMQSGVMDWQFYSPTQRWRLVRKKTLHEIVVLGAALIAGIAAYTALHGPWPADDLDPEHLPALIALLIVTLVTRDILLWVTISGPPTAHRGVERAYASAYRLTLDSLLTIPAFIVTLAYFQDNVATLVITMALLIAGSLVLRTMELSRAALDRQLEELAVLNEVNQALATATGTADLYGLIYMQVVRLIKAPLLYIACTDPQQKDLNFPLVVHYAQRIDWPDAPWGDGPAELIIREREPLCSRTGQEPIFQPVTSSMDASDSYRAAPCRSYLGVPIQYQDEVYGMLAVQHPTRPEQFDGADQRLLETVAAQAAIAMRNTRLHDQGQRFSDGLVSVNQVSSVVNASLDLQVTLKEVCTAARRLGRAVSGVVFLKSEETGQFNPAYSLDVPVSLLNALAESVSRDEARWSALLSRPEVVSIHQIAEDERASWLEPMMAGTGIQAMTIIPFISIRSLINERTLSPARDLIGFQLIFFNAPATPDENTRHLLQMVANQAAVALENTTLFDEAQNSVRRLTYLAEATRIFTESLELNKVAEAVVSWIVDALELDTATLGLWNRDRTPLFVQAHARGYRSRQDTPVPELGQPLDSLPEIEQALQSRWSYVITAGDLDLSPTMRLILSRTRLQTMALTPLVVRDEVIGLLALGKAQAEQMTTNDINMAEAIASQAATAIQNAQLHNLTQDALSDRVAELAVLEGVLRRISVSEEEQAIIHAVIEAAATASRADMISCALTHADGRLDMFWSHRESPTRVQHREFPDSNRGVIGSVIRSAQPSLVPDTKLSPQYWVPDGTEGYRSELTVPIMYQEKVLGVLNLESSQPAFFQQPHLRFLQNLSGHMAIALVRARLFTSNRRQIEILEIIRVFSLRLLEAPDLDTVLAQVCSTSLILTDGINVHIYMYDSDQDILTFAASLWNDGRRNIEIAKPRPNGLTFRAVHAGHSILSDDFQHIPGVGTRRLAIFPLKHRGQIIGTLNAAVTDPDKLGEDEIRALELLANQAASAIERMRLLESRQRQIELLEDLRANSVSLLNSTALDEVGQIICSSALYMIGAEDASLYFYDQERDQLSFAANLWRDGSRNIQKATPRPDGLTYQTARTGRLVQFDRSQLHPDHREHTNAEAMIGVPLKYASQVVGVLNLAVRNAARLGEDEIRTLELLASQSAAALVNVQLIEEIREGRDQMQVILNTVRDGLALFDRRGILLRANSAAEQLLGLPINTYRGQNVLRALARMDWSASPPDDFRRPEHVREIWRQIIEDPYRITRREGRLQRDSGALYLQEESAPVLAENGEPVGRLFIWYNITESHLLAEARQELANTIIHDLRAPLGGIKTSLDMLKGMIGNPEERDISLQIVQIADNSADSLLGLVESLLDVSRLEQGTMLLNIVPTDLNYPLQEATQTLQLRAQQENIALRTAIPADLPPLNIDPDKVRRILINLIDNGMRYTPHGGRILITAEPLPDESFVVISVDDNGSGIPPDKRERIFDRFATGITSGRTAHRGVGLGLTFCKLAVEAHKGRIWVEDGLEGGTSFRFTLPITQ